MRPGDVARLPGGVGARGVVAIALGGARIDELVFAPADERLGGGGILGVVEVAETEVGARIGKRASIVSRKVGFFQAQLGRPLVDGRLDLRCAVMRVNE
jgi:hypothetical protein